MKKLKRSKKFVKYFKLRNIILVFLIIYFSVFIFNQIKPMPEFLNYESKPYYVLEDDISFLYDLTYINNEGELVVEQEIFESFFDMIENSEHYILSDMFLFDNHIGNLEESYLPLSSMLTQSLIEKKQKNPEMIIDFMTDELNTMYGGYENENLEKLKESDINVYFADLNMLRDSNPVYSSLWRMFFIWFGNNPNGGILTHPFNSEYKVTIRSYLKLLNFKANHRKVAIADDGDGNWVSWISSANPHDASSMHSNVGVLIYGSFAKEIYLTQTAVSSGKISDINFKIENNNIRIDDENYLEVVLLTEKKIRDNILSEIRSLEMGDEINLAMFYISDRKIVRELIRASKRGVEINIILDPNKDAFGYEKNGIPNRQVAYELIKKSDNKINLRWYNTNGEQFHSKMIYIQKADGTQITILGSANYTKRNLANYNLELNIKIIGGESSSFFQDINNYFYRILNNEDSIQYTLDYNAYEDTSRLKYFLYRFQEFTGFSTF